MMCKETTTIKVKRTALNRYEWEEEREVDSCIADLAETLENAGIEIKGSCCYHGDDFGVVVLRDKRMLMICDLSDYRSFYWSILAVWTVVWNKCRVGFKRWMK